MMSIIDEEWSYYDPHGLPGIFASHAGEAHAGSFFEVAAVAEGDEARARLAAQAPAMARLLLARVDNSDADLDNADYYCAWCDRGGSYKPDCALVDVLRAAGALPQAADGGGSSPT
ncbi:MAG: hypothetical protein H0U66_09705 [Gemmatimonadaceae bacterium]|nr:hypothetical protein [Gemmatimonadaceae bacterium]